MTQQVDGPSAPAIDVIQPDHPQREEALRLALTAPGDAPARTDRTVTALLDAVEQQGLNADLLLGAKVGQKLIAACVAVESPGRSAMLFHGQTKPFRDPTPQSSPVTKGGNKGVVVALLQAIQPHAWQRKNLLLQSLLNPYDVTIATAHRDAGFHYLAELVYLDCLTNEVCPPRANLPNLTYLTYSNDRHAEFLRTLESSYVESLDCPYLTGLRNTEDVLLGHRHTGVGSPNLWYLACADEQPVGILLLAGVVGRAYLEIVYMGVDARARGKRIGDAMLSHAFDVASKQRAKGITLAVDSTNLYARRMYERRRFREIARRRAWIAHPKR